MSPLSAAGYSAPNPAGDGPPRVSAIRTTAPSIDGPASAVGSAGQLGLRRDAPSNAFAGFIASASRSVSSSTREADALDARLLGDRLSAAASMSLPAAFDVSNLRQDGFRRP